MIFITTGSQGPFDRLIKKMDEMSPSLNDLQVIAQTSGSNYKTMNIKTFEWLSPKEFSHYFNQANLIISHAGMGTIISALVQEKPIIVIPRRAELGEQRNNHQLDTAKIFESLNYVHVVYDEREMLDKIRKVLNGDLKPLYKLGKYASKELLASVKQFIL